MNESNKLNELLQHTMFNWISVMCFSVVVLVLANKQYKLGHLFSCSNVFKTAAISNTKFLL